MEVLFSSETLCSVRITRLRLQTDSADFLLGVFVDPENGSAVFLRNVVLRPNYTAQAAARLCWFLTWLTLRTEDEGHMFL
jgi:hypothetical protein